MNPYSRARTVRLVASGMLIVGIVSLASLVLLGGWGRTAAAGADGTGLTPPPATTPVRGPRPRPTVSAAERAAIATLMARPTIAPEACANGQCAFVNALRLDLLRPDLTAEQRQRLEGKLAFEERMVYEQATAMARAKGKPQPGGYNLPTPLPDHLRPKPPLGVLDTRDNPFKVHAIVTNRWQSEEGRDELLMAFAGAREANAQQGVLVVVNVPPDGTPDEYYDTPRAIGPVRIIAEQNRVLTLAAADGTTFTFDLTTRTWGDRAHP